LHLFRVNEPGCPFGEDAVVYHSARGVESPLLPLYGVDFRWCSATFHNRPTDGLVSFRSRSMKSVYAGPVMVGDGGSNRNRFDRIFPPCWLSVCPTGRTTKSRASIGLSFRILFTCTPLPRWTLRASRVSWTAAVLSTVPSCLQPRKTLLWVHAETETSASCTSSIPETEMLATDCEVHRLDDQFARKPRCFLAWAGAQTYTIRHPTHAVCPSIPLYLGGE